MSKRKPDREKLKDEKSKKRNSETGKFVTKKGSVKTKTNDFGKGGSVKGHGGIPPGKKK